MPRSSRHKSRRSRKHSRDRSVSENEEGVPRDDRPRKEEPTMSSRVRVPRDPEPEKGLSSRTSGGWKDDGSFSIGDALLEHDKKQKDRVDDAAENDRWNGGKEEDYKRIKVEDNIGLDKNSKSKHVVVDLKRRSSRRHDGSNNDNPIKSDSGRRKVEKDSSHRDSSNGMHKDVKDDRERGSDMDRERVSERDREHIYGREKEQAEKEHEHKSVREKYGVSEKEKDRTSQKERNREMETYGADYENSDYLLNQKRGSKLESNEEEYMSRKDVKINELQLKDMVLNTEIEKGVNKRTRNDSEDDKWLDDVRDGNDKRPSSRDGHPKHRSYRDERHEDGKYRDKKLDYVVRDNKHRDDNRRDERPRNRASERYESKLFRDDLKTMDNQYRKTKQDNDNDGVPSVDDRNMRSKDYRGRNQFSDELEDYNETKPRNEKEQQEDTDKKFPTSRTDSQVDKSRSYCRNFDNPDSSLRNNRQKIASSSSAYPIKDQIRDSIKQMESAWKELSSEDRTRPSATCSSSGVQERVSFTRSEKVKLKSDIHSAEIYVETAASTKYERAPMHDVYIPPNQRRERSSSISDRRFSERTGARHSYDTEVGPKNMDLKDGDRAEKTIVDDPSHINPCNRESTPAGSSINPSGHFIVGSPNHLPPPAMRMGPDSSSALGSYENERSQVGDRKSYGCYKRTGDHAFGRGHLNAWKNTPTWHSPLGNGFIPLQHGVPLAGFHPPLAQFPGPTLFGVRPPIDLAHGGSVCYHMHDVADSFHGHGCPFEWHNGIDHPCPAQMQLSDGSYAVFGDEPHLNGRLEWEHNRHLLSSRGWEMNAEFWNSQGDSMNVDFRTPKKECLADPLAEETQNTQHGHQTQDEKLLPHSGHLPTEGNEAKQSIDSPHGNNVSEGPQRIQNIKSSDTSKLSGNRSVNVNSIATYLSRIYISPLLTDSNLYEKCKTLHVPSVTAHSHFQNDEDDSSRRMNAANKILRSFFTTPKESIFQSAVSLYKKQNESSKVKLRIPVICSGEKRETSSEDSGKSEDGQVGERNKLLEEAPTPDDASPTSNMKLQDDTTINTPDDTGITSNMLTEDDTTINAHADGLPAECDDKRPNFCSDAVIYANDSQTCDSPTEEIRVNFNRTPNSPESTH